MNLVPKSEAELRITFRAWRLRTISLFTVFGAGIGLIVFVATSRPPPNSVPPGLFVSMLGGAALALLIARWIAARPMRPKIADYFIKSDEEELRIRGRARGRRVEVRFWWKDIAAITLGRSRKSLLVIYPIIREIDSYALVVSERNGKQIIFEMVGALFSPADLAAFMERAESQLAWHRTSTA